MRRGHSRSSTTERPTPTLPRRISVNPAPAGGQREGSGVQLKRTLLLRHGHGGLVRVDAGAAKMAGAVLFQQTNALDLIGRCGN